MFGACLRICVRVLTLVAAVAIARPAHAITDISFPDPLPTAFVGEPYGFGFVPVGAHLPNSPLLWSIVPANCLPATSGIGLNSNGVLSGTPIAPAVITCAIDAFDTFNDTEVTKQFTLIIRVPPPPPPPPGCTPPTITSAQPPNGTVGVAYAFTVSATGDPSPVLTVTGLPTGLSFDPTSGVIGGRPTVVGQSQLRIVASSQCPPDAVQTPVLTILRSITTLSLTASPNPAYYGQTVTATVRASGGPTVPQGTVQLCVREESAFCPPPFDTVPSGTPPGNIRAPRSATLDGSGQASFALTGLRIDNYVLKARYDGDAAHESASAGPVDEFVIKGVLLAPQVVLVAPAQVKGGATVPVRVVVTSGTPTPVPTGEVRLFADVAAVASATLDASGSAQLQIAAPVSGTLPLRALYEGDLQFSPASSPTVTIAVAAAPDPNTIPALSDIGLALLALGILAAGLSGRRPRRR